jgi:hypothetical protein
MREESRHVVEGFRLPDDGPLSENEHLWIAFLRLAFYEQVPPPPMKVQSARQALLPLLIMDGVSGNKEDRHGSG